MNVLKVGHHGSRSSSSESFIRETSPEIMVISCGKNNMYGHPDEEVLSLLNSNDVKVYRTDEVGTITITADQEDNITVDKKESTIKENAPPEALKMPTKQQRTPKLCTPRIQGNVITKELVLILKAELW